MFGAAEAAEAGDDIQLVARLPDQLLGVLDALPVDLLGHRAADVLVKGPVQSAAAGAAGPDHVLDADRLPEMLVLCGGVMKSGDLILPDVLELLPEYSISTMYDRCRVLPSEIGPDAGVFGAAVYALQQFSRTEGNRQ